MSGSAFAVTHHAFSSGAGRTSDGNGSHASTLKSPSYTKSVSWQHYLFLNSLSSDEQRMFACECGTSIGYLRKALSKGQVLGASLCVLIERASNGEVTRQQLRPFDWMNIWPELEDTKMLTQPLSRSLIHENQA
ncbi:transcriptional regulator [Escherichia coli]|uniref:transcriptional regulator n=8 Tax=Escherichia coli TaxID=562 RepID=UPI003DA83871